MPEVAIFPSNSPNAFATGARQATRRWSLSARGFSRNACSAKRSKRYSAHEVSHVANGDMVTLTLIQGVLNTFVIFLSRIIGGFVDRVVFRNEDGYGIGYFVSTIVAQIILGILASVIVFWFSRRREFRADAGGARLAGRQQMIGALQRLQQASEPEPLPEQMKAFGIAGGGGFARLFSSHPPMEERIAALERG